MECCMMSRERAAAVTGALGALHPRLAQTSNGVPGGMPPSGSPTSGS